MPAEEPYASISLVATAYWFAYFLIILPILGITETPLQQPKTIEEDFDSHYPPKGEFPENSGSKTPEITPAE